MIRIIIKKIKFLQIIFNLDRSFDDGDDNVNFAASLLFVTTGFVEQTKRADHKWQNFDRQRGQRDSKRYRVSFLSLKFENSNFRDYNLINRGCRKFNVQLTYGKIIWQTNMTLS